ncbi:MAG: M23 family metallopeptidase [Alphaproteobacteria bacterium]|nr:M23 family metallopeptidase [Alphaproteobacteria bacterium]
MPEFKKLRKKIRRRRIETFLLAGYAIAVTCALFLSLLNKKTSEDNTPLQYVSEETYDFNNDILTPAFNDSAADNPFELVYTQMNSLPLLSNQDMIIQKFELTQDNHPEILLPVSAKPKYEKRDFSGIYQKEHHVLVVKSGDTFIGMLTNLGMDTKTATDAYNTLKKVFDAHNLKVNQYLELTGTFDIQSHQLEALDTLFFEPERGTKFTLRVNEYDKFEAKAEYEKFNRDVKVVNGVIEAQTSASLIKAGVPRYITDEVIRRFSHLINFRTDIHKGDKFGIKYEVYKTSEGEVIKFGSLLYASFATDKRTYKLYRYKDEFYTERGEAKKTGLDIKPLSFRSARISSLFGYRMHPIYKTRKFHSGVDYAAPRGTQIYASGNGVVEMAQYVNGYGNFVKIRHNSEYETAYGHMQGFARGIRQGIRVRKGQLIGYVGSTGRSTGPHLHFEIIRKGQRINPLKAQVATGNDLTGRQLAEFKQEMRRIDASVEKIARVKKDKKQKLGTTAMQLASYSEKTVQMIPSAAPEQDVTTDKEIFKMQNMDTASSLAQDIENKPKVISESNADAQINSANIEDGEKIATEVLEQTQQSQENTVETAEQKTEVSTDESVAEVAYKGKILLPIRESAEHVRQRHILSKSPLAAKMAKAVKVPSHKPKPKRSLRTSR